MVLGLELESLKAFHKCLIKIQGNSEPFLLNSFSYLVSVYRIWTNYCMGFYLDEDSGYRIEVSSDW